MMKDMSTNEADFHFHGDLNWFLSKAGSRKTFQLPAFLGRISWTVPPKKGERTVHLIFEDHQSVKHLIEAQGIPHVEVGQVEANGLPVTLDYIPHTGDKVEVFPAGHGLPVKPRFMLDNHLGRLTSHLRMLGFDCLYHNDFEDSEMADLLEKDERILLTRDRQLLMRKAVHFGYCLRSLNSQEQLVEVVRRFDLIPHARPFTRCLRCNGDLAPVPKDEIIDQLEPKTKLYYQQFARCTSCGQVYWQGSHWEHMQKLIRELE